MGELPWKINASFGQLKNVWECDVAFMVHRLNNFYTKFNRLKGKELNIDCENIFILVGISLFMYIVACIDFLFYSYYWRKLVSNPSV